MHPEARAWVEEHVRGRHFTRVFEMGSRDINGTVRNLFPGSVYIGCDLEPAKGVDLICSAYDVAFDDGWFDCILSLEHLEHDRNWRESLANGLRMLASGGVMIITAAGLGRAEHGTRAHRPEDSPTTVDYYGPITAAMIESVLEPRYNFASHKLVDSGKDVYFWGVKA